MKYSMNRRAAGFSPSARAFCHNMGMKALIASLLATLLLLPGQGRTAASGFRAPLQEKDLNAFVFAPYLGSGLYLASGNQVSALNFSPGVDLVPARGRRVGWRLNLPFSIGVFDFDLGDLPDQELPTRFDTLTVLPGIEARIDASRRWLVKPFADLGLGRNFGSGANTLVWGAGVRSYYLASRRHRVTLYNRLMRAGFRNRNSGQRGGFSSLETGLIRSFPLPGSLFGRPLSASLHYENFVYFDPAEVVRLAGPWSVSVQHELGLTFGADDWRPDNLVHQPRIGIGWRQTSEGGAVRILFGLPF